MIFLHVIKQSEYLHDVHNKPYLIYTNNGTVDSLVEAGEFDWNNLNDKVYTTDLMYLKYIGVNINDVEDLSFHYYNITNKPLEEDEIPVEAFYKRLYPDLKKTNMLVPFSFHLDHCRTLYQQYKPYISEGFNQFYKKQLDVFFKIESKGIMYKDQLHYSKYNFYTTTGRPSNRFGGINFAALNKKDGSRTNIKSRYENGVLIEVDFQSYHPRLIAELIDYNFPAEISVYEYLARYYNKTYNLTAEQIKEAKDETFKRIYGGLTQHDSIPYFKQAHDYVDGLWKELTASGQLSVPISKRNLYFDNYKDLNKLMFFNYLIQLTETERNVEILHNNPLLDRIMLYIYDAILLDVEESEVEDVIEVINKTIASDKYPVKIKTGHTYGEMQVWSGKPIFIQKGLDE